MLARHGLAACNKFGKRRSTFGHSKGESLIDYVLTRRGAADAEARRARPVDTPLASWRKGGHRGLAGSLTMSWRPWWRDPTKGRVQPAEQSKDAASEDISAVRCLADTAIVETPARIQMPKLENLQTTIAQCWEHHALFRKAGTSWMRQCFELLRQYWRRARRRQRLRQLELLSILSSAEAAAARGDARALFRCVKLLSGLKSSGKLRLRGASEGLVPAEQECSVLTEYARGLFKGSPPPLQALPAEWLSEDQWQRALTQLRPGKAVPNGQPAIASWREDGKTFSVKLADNFQRALCGPELFVPAGWCTVQLAWLPKPPKPPTKPQHLRSVGLTPGDSKAFLLLLKERLSEQVFHALGDTPQFAYRKGVDTSNAILRATSHCREVRALLQRSRQDYAARVAGAPCCRLAGGMMASVDLAKAFDTVPHSEIQCALEELEVDSRLSAVVVRVQTQTQCLIRQAGREAMAEMTRGLRQGCPLAPVLYASWTARLCRLLDAKLGAGWCMTHAIIFADDTLGFWERRSAGDLRKARPLRSSLTCFVSYEIWGLM